LDRPTTSIGAHGVAFANKWFDPYDQIY
jgi:hypothetical protein